MQGAPSHRPPRGLPHGTPGADMTRSAARQAGRLRARGAVWSGCARSTGCRTGTSVATGGGRARSSTARQYAPTGQHTTTTTACPPSYRSARPRWEGLPPWRRHPPPRQAAAKQQERCQPSPPADTTWHVVQAQTARAITVDQPLNRAILIDTEVLALAGPAGLGDGGGRAGGSH